MLFKHLILIINKREVMMIFVAKPVVSCRKKFEEPKPMNVKLIFFSATN